MRELTIEEMEQVDGGWGVFGAVAGAAAGAVGAVASGGGLKEAMVGAAFGSVSGFFLGVAGVSSGFTRAMFTGYSLESTALGSRAIRDMTQGGS